MTKRDSILCSCTTHAEKGQHIFGSLAQAVTRDAKGQHSFGSFAQVTTHVEKGQHSVGGFARVVYTWYEGGAIRERRKTEVRRCHRRAHVE